MTTANRRHYDFLRVHIEGCLLAESLLHCGDGATLLAAEWPSAKANGHINTVCKSEGIGPYIPASTLRGSLRERCPQPSFLFGTARRIDEGQAGAVRVSDALWHSVETDNWDLYWNPKTQTTLRDGVSLDPVTGTAAEGKLFTFEVIPVGTTFRLELEADRISEQDLRLLLGLLAGWDGTLASAIGKGRSKGWGRVRWLSNRLQITATTDQDIAAWVQTNPDVPYPTKKTEIGPMISGDIPAASQWSINFSLRPQSPLLVNDGARVLSKSSSEEHLPVLEYMRIRDGKAIIPGSTLRGALRAHAHRILATIAHQHFQATAESAAKCVKPLIEQLFGKERQRSLLWFGDVIAESTAPHLQPFNAVDRFTGGVAKTALYTVAAAKCELLKGCCTFDLARIQDDDWWKGLLLLLVRDFFDGDLALGWGKSRGFGACTLVIETPDGEILSDGASLLHYLGMRNGVDTPRQWVEQLHRVIKQHCSIKPGPKL